MCRDQTQLWWSPAGISVKIYENFGNVKNVIKTKLSETNLGITVINQGTINVKCL